MSGPVRPESTATSTDSHATDAGGKAGMTSAGPGCEWPSPIKAPLDAQQVFDDAVDQLLSQTQVTAHDADRPDLVARVEAERQRVDLRSPLTVVVAGETKVGKTSLINALVGRSGLLPVDVTVATSVYVVVDYADTARSRVFVAGREDPLEVAEDELPDWVAVDGNPGNRKGVRFAQVSVPSELLKSGVTLIDTPGVGGLDASHARITLAALESADALLFVVDAAAPLSDPEVKFLKKASERIDTVLLVVTKIDLYPQWRVVLDGDRQLLAGAAPRFAYRPLIAVSADVASSAQAKAAAGDTDEAERLSNRSGLTTLKDAIAREVLSRRNVLRLANAVTLCDAVLTELAAVSERLIASYNGDEAPLAALTKKQEALKELEAATQGWESSLRESMERVERELSRYFADELAALRDRFQVEITHHWRRGRHEAIAAEVEADCNRLVVALEQKFEQLAEEAEDEVAESLDLGDIDVDPKRWKLPTRERLKARTAPAELEEKLSIVRSMLSLSGITGAAGVAGVAGVIGLGVVAGPVTIVIGLAAAGIGAVAGWDHLRRATEREEASRILTTSLDQFERDCSAAISDAVHDLQKKYTAAIKSSIGERSQVVQTEIATLTAAVQQVREVEAGRQRAVQLKSATAEELESCHQLQAQMRELVDAINASPSTGDG